MLGVCTLGLDVIGLGEGVGTSVPDCDERRGFGRAGAQERPKSALTLLQESFVEDGDRVGEEETCLE